MKNLFKKKTRIVPTVCCGNGQSEVVHEEIQRTKRPISLRSIITFLVLWFICTGLVYYFNLGDFILSIF